MSGVDWESRLRGVVGKTAAALESELGLTSIRDLLTHYPRTYLEIDKVGSIEDLVEGELVMVVAEPVAAEVHPYQDKRTGRLAYRTEVRARLDDGEIWMTFFDRQQRIANWRASRLRPGRNALLAGKFGTNRFKGGRWELTHPEVADDLDRAPGLLPVYPVSGKLRSAAVQQAVRVALDVVDDIPDLLPPHVRDEHDLVGALQALRWIHRPDDWSQIETARRRLRFDEAFHAQVALAQRRHRLRGITTKPRPGCSGGALDAFHGRMPFELTEGQVRVEQEVTADLCRPHPMHRLLQGEVGSGKTVVALRAMLRVVDSGGQAALLAPTEVLAQQHERSIRALLGSLAEGGMLGADEAATRVVLLTGSLSAAARKGVLAQVESGEAGIVVGTHALLEDRVRFHDLGLVVVDEQHRFGVEQRAALTSRAEADPPHVLVMTATPIPRTVAMTVFGDLETSALTELPAGRGPTQTTVVPLAEQPGWLDRTWARVREEVEQGRQVYVVCPRISGADPEDAAVDESDPEVLFDIDPGPASRPMAAVEEVVADLDGGRLDGLRLDVLHGRLPPDAKEAAMRRFADGETDVLVATTVIEVGVDVANATTMVVLDADRFGVSQLHQLRGRVGRGGHPGLCLLVTHAPAGTQGRARVDAVASTTDGFRLAELDLELRKEGDVLGASQSGTRRSLRLLQAVRDVDVIQAARAAAVAIVEEDPDLADSPALRAELDAFRREQREDLLGTG